MLTCAIFGLLALAAGVQSGKLQRNTTDGISFQSSFYYMFAFYIEPSIL